MNLFAHIPDPDQLSAMLAGLAAFSAVVAVSWPYVFRDTLAERMRKVESERESIRQRERTRLNVEKSKVSLRAEPKRFFQAIVDRFNLAKQAEDGEIFRKLSMAGYRGRAPVTTFLAFRLIAPLVLFAACLTYMLLILRPEAPLIAVIAMASAIGSLGYFAPAIFIQNRITKRQQVIRRSWPEALDLLLITVESGMGIESAFRKVGEEIGAQSPEVAEEILLTTAELSYLQDRRQAFENLGRRTGVEGVRAVVTSLIQAEKYGTPLGQALRVMAQENRDMRMSEAEKKAAGLPPKLTVPMIVFFLPVLFAVIITPAAIQITGL
ncbi:type II secretion system protein [Sinorhizobium fredii USDA 205]|uniref:Type II secretion system F family protein n=1 Tax=Rhizobium fredii TaxID=380 RepID=A0A844A4V8_RHIFR|nr:type II secretion system F family protein [Sinorhizobium fredii]ASY72090.1 Type II/IV secretion system protein TadC, associated with Flp pilus assembly [Sinorhizobium fredii CCBAU 83666]AWM28240.1 Type II/IV secretion system protein TadC associated with Flp pilus assembly [Sinorhizobium fredii CCBAU 25509]KSV84289.1 type II secretion system protein [Sinorhizobium fredii USDA 205]MCG5473617.1 type II secretion system F family protein [Sinorhizobium fredii]MQX08144.1 type II secretion system 